MAIFEWRKFNFFDLKQNADFGVISQALKDVEITCTTCGRSQIIVCDASGSIHIFYKNWECISFKGHDAPIFLCALSSQNNLLVTISHENNTELPIYKVWNLSKITRSNGPPCLKTIKAALQRPTSLAVTENGQFMAIGYDRGGISLYRGDIGRDRSKAVKTLSSGTNPIIGIQFKQQGKITHMFVCSDSGVLVYNLQNKDKEIKIVLDKNQPYEPTRSCAMQVHQGANETHFMVGKDDAIYCYSVDGRGPCYALDGQKMIIEWFRTHLLTITKSTKTVLPNQKEFVLTVIDIQNKFIVYTTPIESVAGILIEFGTCYVLTKNKNVFHLDEKDLQSKLNLLFKKNLYDIAIRIAKNQQYDAEGLAGIFKQYGDHLYTKGNYSGAVEQYVKTIGFLEPSYIIRRFLDSRHIHYLTDYLEALHMQGQATADHTTLLLNCFTRLDLTDKLKEFLSNDKNPDIMFDLDVAIKVCRNASIDLALSLAKRNQKHDYSISILIEDMEAYEEALEYISNLPLHDAEDNLKRYGTILMEHCPDRTTDMLKRLCTNYRPIEDSIMLIETNGENQDRVNPENFIKLFFRHSDKLIVFLEYIVTNISGCNEDVYNTLIELYLQKWQQDTSVENRLMEILKTYDDVYNKDHVLVLCKMYNFWPGILWIYEEEKLYHLVVRYHLKNRDYSNLLLCCKRLGTLEPSLWLQALTGLRSDNQAPPSLLLQVLNVIATEKLQSPLQILSCLAVDSGPNIAHVRDYFLQVFQKEAESARKEEEDVESLRKDLNSLQDHIENLRSNPIEFRSTICNVCHRTLTLPAIYFLCQHSFHQDCIRTYSENEIECSVCHSRNSQLTEALRAQNESRNQHDAFHNLLERAHEPFSVVSEYFGRGLFNKLVVVDEQETQEINKNTIQPLKPSGTNSIREYGTGAEAKLRLGEGSSKAPETVNLVPKAEGRIRTEEAYKYSTSADQKSSSSGPWKRDASTKLTPRSSPQPSNRTPNTIGKNLSNPKKSTNPFESDSLSDELTYDETKNPFNEELPHATTSAEEYDNNLNPFA